MEDRFRAEGLRASSKTVQEALRAHGFGKLPVRSSRKLEQAIRPEDALAANRRELDLPLGRIRAPFGGLFLPLLRRFDLDSLLADCSLAGTPGPPRRVRLPLRTRPQALGPLPSLTRHGPRARRGPALFADLNAPLPSLIRAGFVDTEQPIPWLGNKAPRLVLASPVHDPCISIALMAIKARAPSPLPPTAAPQGFWHRARRRSRSSDSDCSIQGQRVPVWPSVVKLVAIVPRMLRLAQAVRTVPIGTAYAAPSCIRASGNRRSRNLPVRRIQRCRSTGLDHRDCSQTRQTRTHFCRLAAIERRLASTRSASCEY